MKRYYREAEYRRRIREKTEKEENRSQNERYRAAESADIHEIILAIKAIDEKFNRENHKEHTRKKWDRFWEIAGVAGLWIAAAVGIVAVLVSSYDSGEQRWVMQGQLNAMSGQLNEMRQQKRAWIGPSNEEINTPIVSGKSIHITVQYNNTGGVPATNFTSIFHIREFSRKQWVGDAAVDIIISLKDDCFSRTYNTNGTIVAYPTQNGINYNIGLDTIKSNPPIIADNSIIRGDTILSSEGCFIYRSGKNVHHSAFCYYYDSLTTQIAHMNICNIGNDVD
jgi:type II secretory pathway pseudopilin PulG